MLLKAYIKPAILAGIVPLTALGFIYISYTSFGNSILFDQFFIVALGVAAILNLKDVNILGVILITIFIRVLYEISWIAISDIDLRITWFLLLASGFIFYKYRYNEVNKLTAALFFLIIAANIYWFIIDYDKNTGSDLWLTYLVALNVFHRHLLMIRFIKTEQLFPQRSRILSADHRLRAIAVINIVSYSIQVIEYFIRHTTSFNLLFFYNLNSYVSHILATIALWVILNESLKLRLEKILTA